MPLKCTQTILIPAVILVVLVLIVNTFHKFNILSFLSSSNPPNERDLDDNLTLADPAVVYNLLQMTAYGGMAAIIMRLKLFFVPQLCIVTAMLGNRKVSQEAKEI
jgi:quinol-cytochrome oxidoreductase complex cytochrome b subunit